MKTAFVLSHHLGDDGNVSEGMMFECSNQRFGELEENGLVREATPEEIERGYVPPFTGQASDLDADDAEDGDDGDETGEGGEKQQAPYPNKMARQRRTKNNGA